LLRVPFHQFDANLVRSLDECVFDLSTGNRFYFVGNFDPILTQFLEGVRKIVDAEADVIHYPSLGRRHRGLALPMLRISFPRISYRKDDDVHVVHHKRHTWADWKITVEPRRSRRRSRASSHRAEVLRVPLSRRHRVLAEQV